MTDMSQIRRPVALLSELSDDADDAMPDYLYPLVIAARMLGNFAIYDDAVANRARALRIIEQVRRELGHAEQRCQERQGLIVETLYTYDDSMLVADDA